MSSFRQWFASAKPEKRTITSVPWGESVPFNVGGSSSAAMSQASALSLAPVYAANRLLSQSISTLPVRVYRRAGTDRQPLANLPQLFDRLTISGELVPWLCQCVTSLGLRGNAYGLVVTRDGMGFPIDVVWLDPSQVTEDGRYEAPTPRGWLVNGKYVPSADIVHIPWFTLPGQRCGMSPIAAFATTVGTGLQAQSYAYDWFESGGFPPGVMKNVEKKITAEEAAAVKARVTAAMRSNQPLIHGSNWDYTPISVPPEEAQFVETMKLTTNQVAAIYGIPPEMIGGESGSSMTYANVEQQQINFVMFTLRPWLVLLEGAFSALLPERQYVRFNSDALIRADLKTRWDVNKIRVDMGAANIDEIRAQEDEPPLPNGQGQQYGPRPAAINPSPPPGDETPMRRIQ